MHKFKQKLLRGSTPVDVGYSAIDVLQQALDMFKDVAGDLGVPGLQTGVGVLSAVLKLVQVCIAYLILDIEAHVVIRTRMQTLKLSGNWRRKSKVCRGGFGIPQSFMAWAYTLSCKLESEDCYRMCHKIQ